MTTSLLAAWKTPCTAVSLHRGSPATALATLSAATAVLFWKVSELSSISPIGSRPVLSSLVPNQNTAWRPCQPRLDRSRCRPSRLISHLIKSQRRHRIAAPTTMKPPSSASQMLSHIDSNIYEPQHTISPHSPRSIRTPDTHMLQHDDIRLYDLMTPRYITHRTIFQLHTWASVLRHAFYARSDLFLWHRCWGTWLQERYTAWSLGLQESETLTLLLEYLYNSV
ncbi:hypothetical protein BDZ85DRAFT_256545 [Elsinoe ampelina]|uniref:Uncharacterized protein n=1 Tax=Elsinoe ampelina TaxID=302913 RepID=A0A6A6GLQ4_9PEZI|nr:hypothetical protein BDZ85DRAFT_256545 [Elsinoe ampelina]